jgi:hypothetical protein
MVVFLIKCFAPLDTLNAIIRAALLIHLRRHKSLVYTQLQVYFLQACFVVLTVEFRKHIRY